MNNNFRKDVQPRDVICKSHNARIDRHICEIYRPCPSKLSRKELEDIYYALLENNTVLKRTINDQQDKIKVLSTKLQRSNAVNKSKVGKDKDCCKNKTLLNEQKDSMIELQKCNSRLSDRIRVLNMRLCSAKQFAKKSQSQTVHKNNNFRNSSLSALNTKTNDTIRVPSPTNQPEKEEMSTNRSTKTVETETEPAEDDNDKNCSTDRDSVCNENRCRTVIDEMKQKIVDLQQELSKCRSEYVDRITRLECEVRSLNADNERERARLHHQRCHQQHTENELTTQLRDAQTQCVAGEMALQLAIEKSKVSELETQLKMQEMQVHLARSIQELADANKIPKEESPELSSDDQNKKSPRVRYSKRQSADTQSISSRKSVTTPKRVLTSPPLNEYSSDALSPKERQDVTKASDDSGYTDGDRTHDTSDVTQKEDELTQKSMLKINEELLKKISDLQTQLDLLLISNASLKESQKEQSDKEKTAKVEDTTVCSAHKELKTDNNEDNLSRISEEKDEIKYETETGRDKTESVGNEAEQKLSIRNKKSHMRLEINRQEDETSLRSDRPNEDTASVSPEQKQGKCDENNRFQIPGPIPPLARRSSTPKKKIQIPKKMPEEKSVKINERKKSLTDTGTEKPSKSKTAVKCLCKKATEKVICSKKTEGEVKKELEQTGVCCKQENEHTDVCCKQKVADTGVCCKNESDKNDAGVKQQTENTNVGFKEVTEKTDANSKQETDDTDVRFKSDADCQTDTYHIGSSLADSAGKFLLKQEKKEGYYETGADGESSPVMMFEEATQSEVVKDDIEQSTSSSPKCESKSENTQTCNNQRTDKIETEQQTHTQHNPDIATLMRTKTSMTDERTMVYNDKMDYSFDIGEGSADLLKRCAQKDSRDENQLNRRATIDSKIEDRKSIDSRIEERKSLDPKMKDEKLENYSRLEDKIDSRMENKVPEKSLGNKGLSPSSRQSCDPHLKIDDPFSLTRRYTRKDSLREDTYDVKKYEQSTSPDNTEREISSLTDLPDEKAKSPGRLSPGEERRTFSTTENTNTYTDSGSLSEGELPLDNKRKSFEQTKTERRLTMGGRNLKTNELAPKSSSERMELALQSISEELARCRQLLDRRASRANEQGALRLRPAPAASRLLQQQHTCLFTLHIGTLVLSDQAVINSRDLSLVLTWKYFDQSVTMTRVAKGRVVLFDFSAEYNITFTEHFLNYMKNEQMPILICELNHQDEPFAMCRLPLRDALLNLNRRVDMSLALTAGGRAAEGAGGEELGVLDLWCQMRTDLDLHFAITRPSVPESNPLHECQLSDDASADRVSLDLRLDIPPSSSLTNKCDTDSIGKPYRRSVMKYNGTDIQRADDDVTYNDKLKQERRESKQSKGRRFSRRSVASNLGSFEEGSNTRRPSILRNSHVLKRVSSAMIANEIPSNIRSTDELKAAIENRLQNDIDKTDDVFSSKSNRSINSLKTLSARHQLDKLKLNRSLMDKDRPDSIQDDGKLISGLNKMQKTVKYSDTPEDNVPQSASLDEHNPQCIDITVLWLALNEECEAMVSSRIKRLYVSYTFLGRKGADLETPVSLPKPKSSVDKCYFNFRKKIYVHEYELPALAHMCRQRGASGSTHPRDCIVFTVVSEPPEDPLGLATCEDVGYGYVYLGDVLSCSGAGSSYTEVVPVRAARGTAVCGVLAVRLRNLHTLRDARAKHYEHSQL